MFIKDPVKMKLFGFFPFRKFPFMNISVNFQKFFFYVYARNYGMVLCVYDR